MITEKPKILHSTIAHVKAGTPPELRRQHEAVMNELARQAGMAWDGGKPTVPPLPANPYTGKQ